MSNQADYPGDLQRMVDWVCTVATAGQRVLEIGAGDGSMAALLSDSFDVTAVDPATDSVAGVRQVPFESLDEPPFDVVVASVSLHHLHDLAEAGDALQRLTRPGTQLLVREFDIERVDSSHVLRWWFHQRHALDAVTPDPNDHPLPADFDEFVASFFSRMRSHIHPWRDVSDMIGLAGFDEVEHTWEPWLFRWGLGDQFRPIEEQLIAQRRIPATGLRWHGVRRTR